MDYWDFVLTRDDGSVVLLHPSWSNKKCWTRFSLRAEDLEVPRSGMGGSSGSGTYKAMKAKQRDAQVRFDHTKRRPQAAATIYERTD